MKWICTDPDNDQWRLDEGKDLWKDKIHTFRQGEIEDTINLDDYDASYILNIIASYGYRGSPSLGYYFVDGTSIEVDLSIIAECIFEVESL